MRDLTARRGVEPWRRRLYLPAYRISEAARYCGASTQVVTYWHHGGAGLGPVLPGSEPRKPLSYLELVEVAIVAVFREFGVPLQRIRKAREYAAQVFQVDYPFAQLRFKSEEGKRLLLDYMEYEDSDRHLKQVIVADAHGQLAWESMMADKFAEFDYEHDLALVWHVAGRESSVVIDPRIAFGAPMVGGVSTWALKGRWQAGESVRDMEEDFGLNKEEIMDALNFEGILMAA